MNTEQLKTADKTLLDQIKDDVAKEILHVLWGYLTPIGCIQCWPIVCERYATAKAQASCEARWISVKDQMPEPFVSVIVAGGIGFYTGSNWHTITGTAWPGVPIAWEVTHWQPLPSPPTLQ